MINNYVNGETSEVPAESWSGGQPDLIVAKGLAWYRDGVDPTSPGARPSSTEWTLIAYYRGFVVTLVNRNGRWHSATTRQRLASHANPTFDDTFQVLTADQFGDYFEDYARAVFPLFIRPLEISYQAAAASDRDPREKVCANCLAAFTPKSSKGKFCSKGCKQQDHRRKVTK